MSEATLASSQMPELFANLTGPCYEPLVLNGVDVSTLVILPGVYREDEVGLLTRLEPKV